MIILYDYFRSSSAYRVRIALYLKQLDFTSKSVDLVKAEQRSEEYLKLNPQGGVPFFVDGDVKFAQSLAMLEYLDETHPEPAIIYGAAEDKAYIRQLSYIIACDIHPLNNLKVWKGYVGKKLGADEAQLTDWYHHWINEGLKAYEATLAQNDKAGKFSFGDKPSMADICLIPQLYNARRFNVDLSAYPNILKIEKNCLAIEAFQKASPETHPDAPEGLEQIYGPSAAKL